MKQIISNKNLFSYAKTENTCCIITTNGMCTKLGKAVMGAGIAKYAKDNFSIYDINLLNEITEFDFNPNASIDIVLGEMLKNYGNKPFNLGKWKDKITNNVFYVITMPTKNDWRDDSDLELIKLSCEDINTLVTICNINEIYLPLPGCTNGHLNPDAVVPEIENILDDRFTLIRNR